VIHFFIEAHIVQHLFYFFKLKGEVQKIWFLLFIIQHT